MRDGILLPLLRRRGYHRRRFLLGAFLHSYSQCGECEGRQLKALRAVASVEFLKGLVVLLAAPQLTRGQYQHDDARSRSQRNRSLLAGEGEAAGGRRGVPAHDRCRRSSTAATRTASAAARAGLRTCARSPHDRQGDKEPKNKSSPDC